MKFTMATAVIFASMALTSPAWAGLVDFGTGAPPTMRVGTPWVQDGMSMTPVDIGSTHGSVPSPAWVDVKKNFGASAADNSAEIHRGNSTEEVAFTYAGGAFNLDSIDIEGWSLVNATSLSVLFTASSGATYTLNSSFLGTLDFSSLTGWSNITSFTMGVPLGDYGCGVDNPQNDCSAVIFDNVRFDAARESVPEPLTLSLFGGGLAGAVMMRRRRKSA